MKIKAIFWVLLASLVLHIVFLFRQYSIWWDASVYLGMGHYIFSLGQFGIWEPIRPLVWPILLGSFWKIGLNDILFGKLLTIAFSLGIVYLTYLIGKHEFGEEEGLIASIIIALTPVFFFFSYRLYTEIPSLFFAMLAIHFYLKKKPYLAGAFSALAFLTKFPQGIVFAVLVILSIRKMRDVFRMGISFTSVVIPYLIANYLMYGNPIILFKWADEIVKQAGVWLFSAPWYYYIPKILGENILYVFAVLGIILAIRKKRFIIPSFAILFLAYFSMHVHKEIRFAIVFLPYLAILSAEGMKKVFSQKWFVAVISLVCLFIFFTNVPTENFPSTVSHNYLTYLEGERSIGGKILTMHPTVNLYALKSVEPMYYPVFNADLAQKWISYINEHEKEVGFVLMDSCEGGMLCPPDDVMCEENKGKLLGLLKEKYTQVFYETANSCEYWAFKRL